VINRAIILFVLASCAAFAPARGQNVDTTPDTWTATDALGRTLISHDQTTPPRPGKFVGIFYFLWLGQHHTDGPYDITRILARDPDALKNPSSPLWGPQHHFHHWGEPLFGYYLSNDAWVIAKHAQMLSDAGVDVIIFDVTNQVTYAKVYLKLCEVYAELRRHGWRTPQIAFLCPFWDPGKVVSELHATLYKPERYPDLWFRWKDRPLILADKDKVAPECREFFTFRKPQPDYFAGPTGPDQWGWLEIHPQHAFYNMAGKPEQVAVGVGQNASGKRLCAFSEKNTYGRSWHDGKKDERPDAVLHGLNVAEQWERALKVDPEFIFITGWNEWIAGRFDELAGVRMPVMFVDQFDQEHSRDIEPMKGGHGDNYYYQMASFIRRYKGARPQTPVSPGPIRVDGRLEDWAAVQPEFRDTIGDPMRRQHPGWGSAGPYADASGRNDLVLAKVSHDAQQLYFYIRTRRAMTPRTDPNWMVLYLDTDRNASTGWLGYDHVVNRIPPGEAAATLERHSGGYRWSSPVEVPYRVAGNEMELSIPLGALGIASLPDAIDFKWADNIPPSGQAVDFTLHGDAAPNDRFNYRAELRK